MKITKTKGLGDATIRVSTLNNTYFINPDKSLKRTPVKNNCYIEWETNLKGQIIGIIEVFFSKVLLNGRMQEKVISRWGDISSLI